MRIGIGIDTGGTCTDAVALDLDTQELLADKEKLEQLMRECLQKHHGYITAGMFSSYSGLTLYSARKQLNEWTKGENPKLLKTPRGKEHIYTEV